MGIHTKRCPDPPACAEGFYGAMGSLPGPCIKLYACILFPIMPHTPNPPFAPEPLAIFLTWTTYGSWLPGDARGWVDDRGITRVPSTGLAHHARRLMPEHSVVLTTHQRHAVEDAIVAECTFRGWTLHALTCRTNHVHVVVSAGERLPHRVIGSLKAWCSRRLSDGVQRRQRWWTKGGSMRRLYDHRAIEATVEYVVECQDRPRTP